MVLSRGAQRCIKLLRRYARRYKCVFPYRSTLAKELNCSLRQLDNYIAELKRAGLVSVFQSGPQPANYEVLAEQNCEANAKLVRSNGKASRFYPYMNRRTTYEELRRRFPPTVETPRPEVLSLLEWAESEGYPMATGADVIAAEAAYHRRKPQGKAKAWTPAIAIGRQIDDVHRRR